MTIVRGALPVEMYGRDNYGAIAGALATPGLMARAAGPIFRRAAVVDTRGYEWATAVLIAVAAVGALAFAYATHAAAGAPPSPR